MLSREEVDHVARLARLKLSEEERAVLTSQVNEILSYVAKLEELDLTGIEPTAHPVLLRNVFRLDERRPSCDRDEMMANAPDRVDGFFRVPRILER